MDLKARPTGTRAPTDPLHLVLLLVAVLSVGSLVAMTEVSTAVDFYHYWVVPQAVSEGVSPYAPGADEELGRQFLDRALQGGASEGHHRAAAFRRTLSVSGTPFLYTVLAPVGALGFDAGRQLFQIVAGLVGLAGLVAATRLFRYPLAGTLLATALFGSWFVPVQADVQMGNVGLLLLGVLVLLLWLRRDEGPRWSAVLAGVVAGLAASLKPHLAVFAVMLLAFPVFERRWSSVTRLGGGLALGLVLAAVSSSLWFGSPWCWVEWVRYLRGPFADRDFAAWQGNFSLTRFLAETTGRQLGAQILLVLGVGTGALAWLASAVPGARAVGAQERFEREVLGSGLAWVVVLLASPLSWTHYWVLLIPLVLYLLRPLPPPDRTRRALARRIATTVALVGFVTPTIWEGGVPMWIGSSTQHAVSYLVGTTILYAVAAWELVELGGRR